MFEVQPKRQSRVRTALLSPDLLQVSEGVSRKAALVRPTNQYVPLDGHRANPTKMAELFELQNSRGLLVSLGPRIRGALGLSRLGTREAKLVRAI